MTEKEKLIFAKWQTENILKLIKGNEFENYMLLKLSSVYYELDRQIKKLTHNESSSKMEK